MAISRTVRRTVPVAALAASATLLAAGPAQAISGGSTTSDSRYAAVARIQVGGSATTTPVNACGGVLVDPQWVLTAATCLSTGGNPPSAGAPAVPTTVTIGRLDLNASGGQVLAVVEVQPHQQRNLALLRLAGPVDGVAPLALATSTPVNGEVLQAAGFGRTGPNPADVAPGPLRTAGFGVKSLTDAQLNLTGVTATGTASLCKGDAGDPLVRDDGTRLSVAAIVSGSWQTGCVAGETREGATAVRVDDLGAWLDSSIDRPFMVHNVATNTCMELPGITAGFIGQSVVQWDCINSQDDNQQWFFDARGRNASGQVVYSVRNAQDNLCLDVPGYGASGSGTHVIEYYCAGAEDNQFFRIVPRPAGGVWLVNDRAPALCLGLIGNAERVLGQGLDLTECGDSSDNVWTIDPANWTNRPTTQTWLVASTPNNRCFDIPAFDGGYEGDHVFLFFCDGTDKDNQLWRFQPVGKTADGRVLFTIANNKDGYCVTPDGSGTPVSGAGLAEQRCTGDQRQSFTLVPDPSWSDVRIVNEASGLCVDIPEPEANNKNGNGWLRLAGCGNAYQSWILRH